MKIAFIGLGQMGLAMAQNLLATSSHQLTVFNRSPGKAEPLVTAGATLARSAADACSQADVVFSMLANDEAVEDVVFGAQGVAAGLKRDAVHVSCSTISVRLARKLASVHADSHQGFLSCPVFGRPDAAAGKKLVLAVAGDASLIEKVRPLLDSLGRAVFVAGVEPWQANLFKLCGNFMLSSMVESFGEAFAALRKAGANHDQFYEVITEVFGSPVYKNYGNIILNEKFDPAAFVLKLGFKDLRLMLEAAQEMAVPMPIASVVRDQYLSALANGQEDSDWSSITRISARNAGLT